MSIPFSCARRLLLVAALVALVAPHRLTAQSQLDTGEARPFLGAWVISMQSDFGPFTFDLDIQDREGKVGATMSSPEMGGAQEITDISRSGESLVLAFVADAQGQTFDVTVSLEPDGENLAVWFEVGAGEFAMGGVATRATS